MFAPAFATTVLFVMTTLFDEVHVTVVPFVKVHVKVFAPKGMFVTPVLLLFGNIMFAVILSTVHKPVSLPTGALACKLPVPSHDSGVEVIGFEVLGVLFVTITELVAVHPTLVTVHVNS